MITNVSLTTIYCLDQQRAHDFYVDVLGFTTRSDFTMGEGFRWVTVGLAGQPEVEVTLMKPGPPLEPEAAAFIERQLEKGQMGGLGLRVDDCEAVIRDISGNWLVLVEPKEFTGEDLG